VVAANAPNSPETLDGGSVGFPYASFLLDAVDKPKNGS
jgi:hypothetical protein